MSFSPRTQSHSRAGSLWHLSLSLLLLCGVVSWASATPGAANQPAVPLVVDQLELLTLAGSSDNLRPRPTPQRDDAAPENKDTGGSDGSFHGHTASAQLPERLSAGSVAYIFSSPHLPASARYALPASREPPDA